MAVSMEDMSFDSSDGVHKIHAELWRDEDSKPKAAVQILHGMAEHILRYDEFARYLVKQGFAVVGHDHIGHGSSVNSKEEWGHMPIDEGRNILVCDAHLLRLKALKTLGEDLPYFMFGHSMGSFLLRCYLSEHGAGLTGAIICGTGNLPVAISKAGSRMCHDYTSRHGDTYRSKRVDGLAAGGYGKKIKKRRTQLDWLSFNEKNVDNYIADERCGFMFTVGGYDAVTSMSAEAATKKCVAAYPKELPLLYIAGREDPVGNFSKGVASAVSLALNAGMKDVSVKIYPDMRHEILNEADRELVMSDVAEWLESKMPTLK